MTEMAENSIDAIVTDPPYGLSFMGKGWDHGVPGVEFWEAFFRALKPGGHLIAFGGTRTHHRLMVAIEDAGFEIRDTLMWLYGSGFPKSLDVSKAIDKAAGAEREVVGVSSVTGARRGSSIDDGKGYTPGRSFQNVEPVVNHITKPATDAAKEWQGWGTALKPAWEPIILARKPLIGTVAANVKQYGTGAINIDGCRILTTDSLGRWPANVVIDEAAAELLDAQSGERKSGGKVSGREPSQTGSNGIYGIYRRVENTPHDDIGGASRFFYVPKASRSERNTGLDHLPERERRSYEGGAIVSADHPDSSPGGHTKAAQNHHPTVKPLALMQWLCRLVTPPNGVVLDPFLGSGSTLVAAIREGFHGVGIEQDDEYLQIAQARIDHAWQQVNRSSVQTSLF